MAARKRSRRAIEDPDVSARSNRRDFPAAHPLSNWSIAVGVLVVLAVTAVIWFVLLHLYGKEDARVQLDAIRAAGTLTVATGGAVALLLTARRQQYNELSIKQTGHDATERHITELYTKAADQLGSAQAPVRLAGLYALERLGHSTVEHRQAIVDLICAYLRMPYTPPHPVMITGSSYRSPAPARRHGGRVVSLLSSHPAPTIRRSQQEHAELEKQVRLTAQNILFRNLQVRNIYRRRWWHRTWLAGPEWPGISLDLAGAVLIDFPLMGCSLSSADFRGTQFYGPALFRATHFREAVTFDDASFNGTADFIATQFSEAATFEDVQFGGGVSFGVAQLHDDATFTRAQFHHGANFGGTHFGGSSDFESARIPSSIGRSAVLPPNWQTRPADPNTGEDPAYLYLTKTEDSRPGVLDSTRSLSERLAELWYGVSTPDR